MAEREKTLLKRARPDRAGARPYRSPPAPPATTQLARIFHVFLLWSLFSDLARFGSGNNSPEGPIGSRLITRRDFCSSRGSVQALALADFGQAPPLAASGARLEVSCCC